jgi:hypothetical protein
MMGPTISSQTSRNKHASSLDLSAFFARAVKVRSSVDKSRTLSCVTRNGI